MEYILGSVITLVVLLVAFALIKRNPIEPPIRITYSQSHVYSLLAPFIPSNSEMREPPVTQATKYLDSITMRVVFLEGKAYWIKDSKFYVADAVNHMVNHETATEVDTMAMDKVQLDKIKLVVEKLSEGSNNDSRNSS